MEKENNKNTRKLLHRVSATGIIICCLAASVVNSVTLKCIFGVLGLICLIGVICAVWVWKCPNCGKIQPIRRSSDSNNCVYCGEEIHKN